MSKSNKESSMTKKSVELETKAFNEFAKEFREESDRAAVILGAEKLDLYLYQILIKVLFPNASSQDDLFNGDGPLSAFSAKIHLCYRLRLHFEQIVEKAGLKGKAHFHLLRHAVASALARAGADPVSIQYMLGHANLSTTEIYLHPHRDAKRKAAELLEKQLPIGNLNGEKSALQG